MKTGQTLPKRITNGSWTSMAAALCPHRRGAVAKGRSRTVTDDSGTLAITAWTCADCGELIEEIHILSRDGKAESRPARYSLVPPRRLTNVQANTGRH